jgi:hypothetical protein
LGVHYDGDLPARSGLGSSSAFTVGLINSLSALRGNFCSKKSLALNAVHIEQKQICEVVGSQDQIAAAYGGMNRIEFLRGGEFEVTPITLNPEKSKSLNSHLMLFFTGVSRFASEIAKTKIENFRNKEKTLLARINVMPEDIVLHIKSYLTPTIILGAIAIPRFELHDHMYPIKMKYTKIVYNRIRKNIPDLIGMMNSLSYREVIRREDYNVLYARQPGTKKQQVTDRISEILYCYHLILNIVSKVQKPSPENTSRSHILCSKTTTMLLNELTYIYKFINFSAKQNKTQNKPAKKQSRREEQA